MGRLEIQYAKEVGISATIDKTAIKKLRDRIGRIITNLPKKADVDAHEMAVISGREMKFSAMSAGIMPFEGELFRSLDVPVKNNNADYGIVIPGYGYSLDEMEGHEAPLSSWPLGDWVKTRKSQNNGKLVPGSGINYGPGWIRVEPHPWIKEGRRNAREKLREMFAHGETMQEIKK
jgi:hypothetical protein